MFHSILRVLSQSKEYIFKHKIKVMLSVLAFIGFAFLIIPLFTKNISITTSTGSKIIPIYSVDTPDKKVAISFDAAWGNEQTPILLEILKKHNVKTTFFMTGVWIEQYPEDVKSIKAAGHDLGNHSENHKHMPQLSREQQKEEIMKAHNKVKELVGEDMVLYRPPYGDYSNSDQEVAAECGYKVVQWSVDSLDWKDYGVENLVSTVVNHKNLTNGAIVLLHNGAKYTPDSLEKVIIGLKEKGYEIVPISELIYFDNYKIDHTGQQILIK